MQLSLMTTETRVLGNHEALFWGDGKLEIEEIADEQGPDHICERVCLDEIAQYRLYLLLREKFVAQDGRA